MNYTKLKLATILSSTLFLFNCASAPSNITMSPQLHTTDALTKIESDNSWSLNSKDFRTQRYLIAISAGDDVATLVNESASSRLIVEQALQNHWMKQGHTFTSENDNAYKIEIQLIKLLAEVEQGSLSHDSNINIVLKVQLSNEKTTFSKTFRSHYEEESPLSVNVDKLAIKLNTQLSQLLDQIVQDPELNAKLTQL